MWHTVSLLNLPKTFVSTGIKTTNDMADFGLQPEICDRNAVTHIYEIATEESKSKDKLAYLKSMIGRLYTAHHYQHECFFLHILLINMPSTMSYLQTTTVKSITHAMFCGACQALNLL